MDHGNLHNNWGLFSCGGSAAAEKTVINYPFMQRFRPIAPKPVSGDSGSGGSQILLPYKARSKRKYVRVCKNNKRKKKDSPSSTSSQEEKSSLTTLQLLPGNTELNPGEEINLNNPVQENIGGIYQTPDHSRLIENTMFQGLDLMVMMKREVVESWVMVECVTDNPCMEMGAALGRISTEVERVKDYLDKDTCPWLITDGCDRVEWVNAAYKRMVTAGGAKMGEILPEIRVWMVVKEGFVLPWLNAAFSCRVRVQYTWRKQKWSKTVPCDVWRIDGGGFAWRLDVEAALSLGR